VERGASRDLIDEATLSASRERIERLRKSLPTPTLRPGVVGPDNSEHLELAHELAEKSITVVRNDDGLLPLRLESNARLLSLEPVPTNVTPADTTALYPPVLADSLRARSEYVTEIVYPHQPRRTDIDAAVAQAGQHDLVVVGTVNAASEQADLVRALIATGKPVVTVALRTPYDLARYPEARTHLCTYSGHQPSLTTLAGYLFNGADDFGTLPVTIPELYPRGHGLRI